MFRAAKWIWRPESRTDWNDWVAFRCAFDLPKKPEIANLTVTADARYWAWINGEFVSEGPPRGYPDDWMVDLRDVAALLRAGANRLTILVHAPGVSTFQYIHSDAGLIAELEADGHLVAATDAKWECLPGALGLAKERRICCQMGWQEPPWSDRRPALFGDGAGWIPAVEVTDDRRLHPAHSSIAPPEPVPAAAVVSAATVRRPRTSWSFSLRRFLLPGYLDAAPQQIHGVVGIGFHVKHPGTILFEFPPPWFWVRPSGNLNGALLIEAESRHNPWQRGIALQGEVRPGRNFVAFDVSGHFHEWTLALTVDDVELELTGPVMVANTGDNPALKAELAAAESEHAWLGRPGVAVLPPDDPAIDASAPAGLTAYAEDAEPLGGAQAEDFALPDAEGRVILDLGRMAVGHWDFEAVSDAPTRLVLHGFEAYQEGKPDFPWEMSNTFEVDLPAGRSHVMSLLRRGARYVSVQGQRVRVTGFKTLEATRRYGAPAEYRCGDPILEDVYQMSLLTLRLCSEDTFVDCPTYEQTHWVGDMRTEALVNYAVLGDVPLVRRCLQLGAQSLQKSTFVESHVPSGWHSIIPAWSFLWAVACWEHAIFTGDRDFLREILPSLASQLTAARAHIGDEGLFEIEAWNLSDWAPMDAPGRGVVTANQGWLALAARATHDAAAWLGETSLADEALSLWHGLKEPVNRRLWSSEKQAYVDCIDPESGSPSQTFSVQTQCLLFLAGLVPFERSDRIAQILRTGAGDEGFVQVGTPFFAFFLFEALEKLGETHRIIEIIKEKWGFMRNAGSTTCWELFPGYLPAGRWTRSYCHAWSCAPAYFLQRHALGLRQLNIGATEFVFTPGRAPFEECEGESATPHGMIRARWRRTPDGVEAEVEVPDGVTVETVTP